jgi:hypothetical protein
MIKTFTKNSPDMNIASIRSALLDSLSSLWVHLRAAVLVPIRDTEACHTDRDADFEGWLRGDPRVTMDPANRYSERRRGYITSNGIGSFEVGAADD